MTATEELDYTGLKFLINQIRYKEDSGINNSGSSFLVKIYIRFQLQTPIFLKKIMWLKSIKLINQKKNLLSQIYYKNLYRIHEKKCPVYPCPVYLSPVYPSPV